jgi:hypothetical protein
MDSLDYQSTILAYIKDLDEVTLYILDYFLEYKIKVKKGT